jgi:dihydrofolate synthase/folylpolyglutamate synthase
MQNEIHLGLDRIRTLLFRLKNPQKDIPTIHVAGTNGKGSTCACISHVLIRNGYKTGTFTSPHLLEVHDMISINNQSLDKSEFDLLMSEIEEVNVDINASQFEKLTAAAFLAFRKNQVDIMVLEVGLGGRLDATNICDPPLVCVITSIDLDHVEFLGNTIREITNEKGGIIKEGAKYVIVGPQRYLECENRLLDIAKSCNVPIHFVKAKEDICCQESVPFTEISIFETSLRFPVVLKGHYQIGNASTAVSAILALKKYAPNFNRITEEGIISGMASVYIPGRLDIVKYKERYVTIDGAHNVGAAIELARYLHENTLHPRCWVVAFTHSKNALDILKPLIKNGDVIIATVFSLPERMPWIKSMDPENIRCLVGQIGSFDTFVADSIVDALALTEKFKNYQTIVCGSLYLVADFYRLRSRTSV